MAVATRRVFVGMSGNAVLASWGRPRDINRTVTANGTRQQWIYGEFPSARYVYLTNGTVTAIQD